jgi:hypothetical protein
MQVVPMSHQYSYRGFQPFLSFSPFIVCDVLSLDAFLRSWGNMLLTLMPEAEAPAPEALAPALALGVSAAPRFVFVLSYGKYHEGDQ